MRKLLTSLLLFLALSTAQAQIIGSFPYNLTNGTTADASQVMANYNYIASQVNANGANAGANSNITSLLGLTTPLSAGQGGSQLYTAGTSTGSANAQVVATGITPVGFTLLGKSTVCFTWGFTNTGALTLNVNNTGATNVYKSTPFGQVALAGGEAVAGVYTCVRYDGTAYGLTSPSFSPGFVGQHASMTTTTVLTSANYGSLLEIGGSTNYTVTLPSPFDGGAFYVFNSNTGTTTLSSPSGNFTGPGSSGAGTQTLPSNSVQTLYSDGTNWVIAQHLPLGVPTTSVGVALPGANGLSITNNGTTPSTKIDISANTAIVTNSSGYGFYISSYTCTINLSINGVGGLDTGSIAASTWYHLYVVSTGSTNSCLASISATSPTLPTGYTYYYRVGAMQTDGSSNLYRTLQKGNRARYKLTSTSNTSTYPFFSAANPGSWFSYTVTGNASGAPSTSVSIVGILVTPQGSSLGASIAPNNLGNTPSSLPANPMYTYGWGAGGTSASVGSQVDIILESSNVYFWNNNSNAYFELVGWTDSVNAN
jgi:hypothetical protein